MAMLKALRDVLETNHVPYLLRTHPRVYTSQETAAVQHVPADGQSGDGQERPTAHHDGALREPSGELLPIESRPGWRGRTRSRT